MISPAHTIRVAVEAALAADFNETLETVCTSYGIPYEDFTLVLSPVGSNYFRAAFTIEDLREKVSLNQWPCVTLTARASMDEQDQSFTTFDGSVTVDLSVHYAFDEEAVDMETLPDAVEVAALTCLTAVRGLKKATLAVERTPPVFYNSRWFISQVFSAAYAVQQL